MKKSNFTLLEALCAAVILALGAAGLLAQLVMASARQEAQQARWHETHDLILAAEHLLLAGREGTLNREWFDEEHELTFAWRPVPEQEDTVELSALRLWTLTVYLRKNGVTMDELEVETLLNE